MRSAFVYIMASARNGTLYIGVTSDLVGRVWKHKEGVLGGFTGKYNVKQLVYYEVFDDIREALQREKQLKKWSRKWKLELIEKSNRAWDDLYYDLV